MRAHLLGDRRGRCALIAVTVAACGGEDAPGEHVSTGLEVVRTITLEESDSVLSMAPNVSVSDDGSLVVAEPQQASVRLHGADGRLLMEIGREGEGPGEFLSPVAAMRAGGSIWVLDVQRGLTEWDASSGELLTELPAPFGLNLGLSALGDSLLLVAGLTLSEEPWRLLRTVDPATGDVRSAFFEHVVPPDRFGLAMSLAWIPVATTPGQDQVMAIHSWSDTLKVFRPSDGTIVRSIPVDIPEFTYEGTTPSPETLQRLRVVRGLELMPDGGMVLQYAKLSERAEAEMYGLLLLSPEGRVLYHQTDVARLLDVAGSDLYFSDPSGLRPAEITVMRFR